MKISELIWLDDVIEKITLKHAVKTSEVKEILSNSPYFRFIEKGHRTKENVYAAMGKTDSGRYLIVFFVYKTDKSALIISVRDMSKAERRLYEKT